MSEHLEELERSSELKNRGVLTEEEFEDGKAKLLNKRPSLGRSAASVKRYLALSALGIGAVGAFFFAKAALVEPRAADVAGEASAVTPSSPVSLFAPASMWSVTSARDPISDTTIEKAVAIVEGKQFDVEVSISCSDAGEMRYGFTSFDKSGEPAQMRSEVYASNFSAGYRIPFQLKPEGAPALTLGKYNPAYNNQVEIRSTSPMPEQDINFKTLHKLATSDRLVARFFMLTGEETVEIPQTDAAVRKFIDRCVAQRDARMAGRNALQAKELRQRKALVEEQRRQEAMRSFPTENRRQQLPDILPLEAPTLAAKGETR